jgi:hypothetical protein
MLPVSTYDTVGTCNLRKRIAVHYASRYNIVVRSFTHTTGIRVHTPYFKRQYDRSVAERYTSYLPIMKVAL